MRIHFGATAFVAFTLLLIVGWHRSETLSDGKVKACGQFAGGKLNATWTECPDKVRREVSCAPFVDSLKCDCLEDGVQKWFFTGKDPPMSTREDATRVANTNCHWSLE